MGVHFGSTDLPWPTVSFGGLRLWDTHTGWAEINTAFGQYDWSNLDSFVADAQAHNVDVLYNLARTPTWASSSPNDSSCACASISGNGQCWPPIDLNADGSGTDKDWITWVTAVASRYKGQIKYYEIWNEWNVPLFWQGTPAQLVRMEQDARCVVAGPPSGFSCNANGSVFPSGTAIDPNARIVTPSPVGAHSNLTSVADNLATYFRTNVGGADGGAFADILGFHAYVGTSNSGRCPIPEDVNTVVDNLNSTLASFASEQGKPWFNTEGGWSKADDEGFLDPDRQAAFLARYFLLQRSLGVERVYSVAGIVRIPPLSGPHHRARFRKPARPMEKSRGGSLEPL